MNTTNVKKILQLKNHITNTDENVGNAKLPRYRRNSATMQRFIHNSINTRSPPSTIVSISYDDLKRTCAMIEAFNAVLACTRIVPVVEAAKPPPVPTKPKNMKFTELPIYYESHTKYFDHEYSKLYCAAMKAKPMIQTKLLPYVHDTRREVRKQAEELRRNINQVVDCVTGAIIRNSDKFVAAMRDDTNLALRQGFVANAGFHFGNRRNHVSKKLFFAALAATYSGMLCMPHETDLCIREFFDSVARISIKLINLWYGANFVMRDRLPCSCDLPEASAIIKSRNKCPKAK